jgi:hypothetical protein
VQAALAADEDAEQSRQSNNQRQEQGQQLQFNAADPEPRREEEAPKTVWIVPHAPSAASQMERSELSRRYNEFHALIVQTAKHFCVKGTPKCEVCPLREMLPPKLQSR